MYCFLDLGLLPVTHPPQVGFLLGPFGPSSIHITALPCLTSVFHRQKISENRTLDAGSGTTRPTSRTPDQHPNRPQRSPQSPISPDDRPDFILKNTRIWLAENLDFGISRRRPRGQAAYLRGTPERHRYPNRLYRKHLRQLLQPLSLHSHEHKRRPSYGLRLSRRRRTHQVT